RADRPRTIWLVTRGNRPAIVVGKQIVGSGDVARKYAARERQVWIRLRLHALPGRAVAGQPFAGIPGREAINRRAGATDRAYIVIPARLHHAAHTGAIGRDRRVGDRVPGSLIGDRAGDRRQLRRWHFSGAVETWHAIRDANCVQGDVNAAGARAERATLDLQA